MPEQHWVDPDNSEDFSASGRGNNGPDREVHIKTNFLAHQAAEVSTSPMSSGPVRFVLFVILIGIAYGVWQISTYFLDYGRIIAVRNCVVTLQHPVDKDGQMYVDVSVENNNPSEIVDPVLKYSILSSTGATVSEGQAKIAGIVPPADSRVFSQVKLGAVTSERGHMQAELSDMKLANKADLPDDLSQKFVSASALPDKDAIEPFKDFVHQAPHFGPGFIGLGEAFAANGKFDEAIEAYKKALELVPDDVDAHYNLAVALYHKGDKEGAKREIEKAYQLRPGDTTISQARAQLLEAMKK
jgi:TPR repeat protein